MTSRRFAVALLLSSVLTACAGESGTPVSTGVGTTTTAEAVEGEIVPAPSHDDSGPAIAVFVWPFLEHSPYKSPEALADAFAREYLGMPDPRLGTYRPDHSHAGTIDVHPYPTGTIGSTLSVSGDDEGGWHLTTVKSPNLVVDSPLGDTITSPVHVKGRSVAFEGNVQVSLLADATNLSCVTVEAGTCGNRDGVLANTRFTGSGSEMEPFELDVPFTKQDGQQIAVIVLWTASARDGSIAEATLQPVWLVPVSKV